MSRPAGGPNVRPRGHEPDLKKMEFYEGVARAIRDARNAEGLSMRELGERAGMSATQIGSIEANDAMCSLYAAARIAEALDITLEDIARITISVEVSS